MTAIKTFRGILVCDVVTGEMRLLEQSEVAGPWEVSVDVTIRVNPPGEVRGVLIAEITCPEMVIVQADLNEEIRKIAGGE